MSISISIIIPCYNGWKHMGNCLTSLENQRIRPDQVIVIDDGSTDDSYARLLEYKKTSPLNLVVEKNERNCGPGKSREYALRFAAGEYIAFCDCDDWYCVDFISCVTQEVERSGADLVVFDSYISDHDARLRRANTTKQLVGMGKKEILALYPMSLCRFVVRRDLFRGVAWPEIYHGEDGAVAPQIIAAAQRIAVLDQPFYYYFYREGSASSQVSPNVYKELVMAFDLVARTVPNDFPEEKEFLGVKLLCYGAVLNACKAGASGREMARILSGFEMRYENWDKNPYMRSLGIQKRAFLFLVRRRLWGASRFLARAHQWMVARMSGR